MRLAFIPRNADPEIRLGLMDKYGVDIQALSQTTLTLSGRSPEAGEDYIHENLAGVMAMEILAEEKEKILGGNAKKLLKID